MLLVSLVRKMRVLSEKREAVGFFFSFGCLTRSPLLAVGPQGIVRFSDLSYFRDAIFRRMFMGFFFSLTCE